MKVDRSMQNMEQLIEKAGGHFRFTTLLTKRVRELIMGSPALIPERFPDPISQALAEFIEGRYTLIPPELKSETEELPE